MRKSIVSALLLLTPFICLCQADRGLIELNLGFEQSNATGTLPKDWVRWGSGYTIKTDKSIKKSGEASLLIEPDKTHAQTSTGYAAYPIFSDFQAEEIEVRAFMKLNNVTGGAAGLLLRMDGAASMVLSYDNTLGKSTQGTKEWAVYSIKKKFPPNVRTIYVGAILSGKGQLWVDDFQLLLDGKVITQSKPHVPAGLNADEGNEFNDSSKISPFELTPSKVSDLDILGKVWGFLKYYHPAIAAGNYNWDAELFRMLPRIVESKHHLERNAILASWVKGLGNFETELREKPDEKKIKLYPDLSWIRTETLGTELTTTLNGVKTAKRIKEHYYIAEKTDRFTNEREYNTMHYPDVGFQLLSLYRYWNIIQYYFPYRNLIDEDWNNVLVEFIPRFVNAGSKLEYKLTLLSLIARIHDTHANLWVDETINDYRGQNYAPLEITFVENKAVVTDYLDKSLGEKTGIKIGDIIETVDNKNVNDIIKEKLPFTSASNYPTQLREIGRNLLRTTQSSVLIEYKSGKKKVTTQVETFSTKQIDIYSAFHKSDTCFKLINNKISYIYPGLIKNKYLPRIMEEVKNTIGLIIDLRCYPSEVILPTLGEYLVAEPTSFVRFSLPNITTPGLFLMTEPRKFGKDNPDHFKGKVVIIVNESTQSQAEFTTMAFRKAPQAVVIGSTTAGADGDVARFLLPGAIFTMISGIGVYYPDGTETQRVGIIPDIEVKPTIKGIKEGRDELLEKAIQLID